MKMIESTATIKVTVELTLDEIHNARRDLGLVQKFFNDKVTSVDVAVAEPTINKLLNLFNKIGV